MAQGLLGNRACACFDLSLFRFRTEKTKNGNYYHVMLAYFI